MNDKSLYILKEKSFRLIPAKYFCNIKKIMFLWFLQSLNVFQQERTLDMGIQHKVCQNP